MNLRNAILLFFLSISFFSVAQQQDDAYKMFLKGSSVAIHKAQKEMIRSNKMDESGLLAKSVILQNYALKLYKSNNSSKAVCVGAIAKKYAVSIIKDLNKIEEAAYQITDSEKKLLNNCSNDIELYNESKSEANNPSELDKDYIRSFNNLKIDFN